MSKSIRTSDSDSELDRSPRVTTFWGGVVGTGVRRCRFGDLELDSGLQGFEGGLERRCFFGDGRPIAGRLAAAAVKGYGC